MYEAKACPYPRTVTRGGWAPVVGTCQLPWVSRKSREVSGLWNFPSIHTTFSQNQTALDPNSEGQALSHAATSSTGTLSICSFHRLQKLEVDTRRSPQGRSAHRPASGRIPPLPTLLGAGQVLDLPAGTLTTLF